MSCKIHCTSCSDKCSKLKRVTVRISMMEMSIVDKVILKRTAFLQYLCTVL